MTLKLRTDLRQRHLEAFEDAFADMDKTKTGQSILRRMTVETALRAGWYGDNADADLGEMTGREIARLSEQVWTLYRELTDIDPN